MRMMLASLRIVAKPAVADAHDAREPWGMWVNVHQLTCMMRTSLVVMNVQQLMRMGCG